MARGDENHASARRKRQQERESTTTHVQEPQAPTQMGFDGGPIDASLLVDFKSHVSRSIWEKRETHPLLTVTHHYQSLYDHWDFNKECTKFVELVKKSGLAPAVECMFRHVDRSLVSAFVERWIPETNTFHMPWGEMTITPHDVVQIMGLNVGGLAVQGVKWMKGGEKVDWEMSISLMENCFGVQKEELEQMVDVKQGYSVSCKWLRESFKKGGPRGVTDESTEVEIERAVRAYLLYVLANSVLPKKSGNRISLCYARDLEYSFDDLQRIAWGTALLTFIYRQLGEASRQKCAQFSGNMTLIETWIYEQFPCLSIGIPMNEEYTLDFPRAKKYLPMCTSNKGIKDVEKLRISIDNMPIEAVIWNPYEDVTVDPFAFFRGLIYENVSIEPYHPDRVLRQFGYVQHIPDHPIPPVSSLRPSNSVYYKVLYDTFYQFGVRWKDHTIPQNMRVLASSASECNDDYLEWFLRISHPRVHPPTLVGANDHIWNEQVFEAINTLEEGKKSYKDGKRRVTTLTTNIDKVLSILKAIPCYSAPRIEGSHPLVREDEEHREIGEPSTRKRKARGTKKKAKSN